MIEMRRSEYQKSIYNCYDEIELFKNISALTLEIFEKDENNIVKISFFLGLNKKSSIVINFCF